MTIREPAPVPLYGASAHQQSARREVPLAEVPRVAFQRVGEVSHSRGTTAIGIRGIGVVPGGLTVVVGSVEITATEAAAMRDTLDRALATLWRLADPQTRLDWQAGNGVRDPDAPEGA